MMFLINTTAFGWYLPCGNLSEILYCQRLILPLRMLKALALGSP